MRDQYKSIDKLIEAEFPKKDNPLSPRLKTKIYNIRWNGNYSSLNKEVKTVQDLIKVLSASDKYYFYHNDIHISKENTVKIAPIHNGLCRKGKKYSVEEIREATKDVLFNKQKSKETLIDLDEDLIYGNSDRYQTFLTNGTKCCKCGIEGKYFVKEKHAADKRYHLNLYALNENGEEVLMTKDHIIPRSKGGKNELENYQTMCKICNELKGNQL